MAYSHEYGHSHEHDHHHSDNILVKLAMALHLPGFTRDYSHSDLAYLTPVEFEEEWNKCPR